MAQTTSRDSAPPKKGQQPRRHDRSRRLLFSHPRMVRDLLRGFVKKPWVRGLDLSTLKKLAPDFLTAELGGIDERLADVVWQVREKQGRVRYVLVIEFLSKPQPFVALRLALYVLLFYHALIKEEELTTEEKLPLVVAILLYNGEEEYEEATELAELIESVSEDVAPYRISMRYLLINERTWPRLELEKADRNALATFFRLQLSDSEEMSKLVLEEKVLDWLEEEDEGLLRDLLAWVSRVHLPELLPDTPIPPMKSLDEFKNLMEKDMETWQDMWKAEGQADFFLSLYEERFGDADEELRTQVRSADPGLLLLWGKRILTAQSREDVFRNNGAP